jgi:ParB family chromosome partitioning protein
MGNAPEGATSTKAYSLEVGTPGFDQFWLADDPGHILYNEERLSLPLNPAMIESIADQGVIEPIICRRVNGRLEIIAGAQRYKNAVAAKEKYPDRRIFVPFLTRTIEDHRALQTMVVENEQRTGESIVSRGKMAARMQEKGYPEADICTLYNRAWPTIERWILVAQASDAVKSAVVDGRISETAAMAIARKPIKRQASLVEKEAAKGRQKPGRKRRGSTGERTSVTVTRGDGGGFSLRIKNCSDDALRFLHEQVVGLYEERFGVGQ